MSVGGSRGKELKYENRSYRCIQLFGKIHHQTTTGTRRGSHHTDRASEPPRPIQRLVKAYPLDFDEAGMTAACRAWRCWSTPTGCVSTRTGIPSRAPWKIPANWSMLPKLPVSSGSSTSASPIHRQTLHLPYFWGKAANEKAVINSGMHYAILRPTVLVGKEDILINNIAYLLQALPVLPPPGQRVV